MRAVSSERGVGLIEVLVSLLIFSFGILGLVGLQARAMQHQAQAGDRTRAALLADEMVASMWVNQSTTVSSATLSAWQARIADTSAAGLPSGSGSVSAADSDGVVTITITWRPPTRKSSEPVQSYLTQVVIP